jgi:hypothetical protein
MKIERSRGAGQSLAQGRKTARERELTTKRRGELSELAFVYKAATQGFHVAKPYGDSERYDCILDNGHRLWRVQIKSSTCIRNGLYRVNACRHTCQGPACYRASEIDFFAAYIIPEETWFILPVELIVGRRTVYFARRGDPRRPDHYAEYREAWHLLRD